jgi:hypothetical protein
LGCCREWGRVGAGASSFPSFIPHLRLTKGIEQGNKRRKIVYQIPEEEFDPAVASKPLEVLELADIRKEYTVALARLQLSGEFPELERTSAFPSSYIYFGDEADTHSAPLAQTSTLTTKPSSRSSRKRALSIKLSRRDGCSVSTFRRYSRRSRNVA